MPIQKSHLSALGVAAVLACALPAIAQNFPGLPPNVHVDVDVQAHPVNQIENRYRIGIDCARVPESLRVHLRLNEDTGLLVNSVLDSSPGGRAGIERHDVIVAADGHPVSTVYDLVNAVNRAKDSEMKLSVIQAGEEKTITLTPEERNAEEIERLRNGFANRLGQQNFGIPDLRGLNLGDMQAEVERAIEQMQGQLGPMQNGWRRLGPGFMMDLQNLGGISGGGYTKSSTSRSFPMANGEQVTIKVDREGDKPAKIHVERGSESWDLSESELDELPDEIRPLVESQLNGSGGIQALMAPMPNFPGAPVPPKAAPRSNRRIQDRFDGLELKMQELQDAIRSIQGDE